MSTATPNGNGCHNMTLPESRRLLAAGISMLPTNRNKLPAGWLLPADPEDETRRTWKPFQERLPTQDEIDNWFGGESPKAGIAIVHGAISGNLETLDFDYEAETTFPRWKELVESQARGLIDRLTLIGTPRGGFHVRYRCAEPVEGNQKLAEVQSDGKALVRIETRGEGGYTVGPGTLPRFHPSNKPYTHLAGPSTWEPSVITAAERAILLNAARAFDLMPYEPAQERSAGGWKWEVTPWDDFNARGPSWSDILSSRQWNFVRDRGGVGYWRHPAANGEYSATVNFSGNDLLHVFSTNAGIPAQKSYSRYAAVVFLDYSGDFTRAAEEIARQGFGKMKPIQRQPAAQKTTAPAPWSDPQPLPSGIPDVLSFNDELLPWSFRGWLRDVAERTQAPIDFSAAAAMVALSAVIGRRIAIRPKQHDDWSVIPNLWGMAVGKPGVMKSQAIQESFRPLTRLEIEAGERYEKAVRDFASQQMIAEARKKAAQSEIAKALKNGDASLAKELADRAVDEELQKPARVRYLVSDATVEKMGEILKDNPRGVAQLRDEVLGLLKSLDREGQEGSRAFLLEGWDGNGRFVFDRISRGTIIVEAICISIFGGIQPGPLFEYQRAAARNGSEADGLLQRFQLAVYPDVSRDWVNVDRWPDLEAKNLAYSVFTTLEKLDPADVGAQHDDRDPHAIPFLRFAPDAQKAFNAWREKLEPRLRSDVEHPAIASHLGKYRSLVPSLALLIHLAEQGEAGAVGIEPLEKALGWARYLESHARRIFAAAVGDDMQGAKSLVEKLQAGELRDGFALREVYRHGWSGLTTKEDAEEAVGMLCDLEWIRETPDSTVKRRRFEVNPKVTVEVQNAN
jgi:putative DNA primase/helicase